MAKINFGAGIEDARGSFGGMTFSVNRYGAYIRRKVSPVQPTTPAQSLIRERLTGLSKRYGGTLTETQRRHWRELASTNPITDVFGETKILAANGLFCKVNMNRLQCGGSILDDAPADLDVGSIVSVSMESCDAGMSEVEINFSPACEASERLMYRFVPNVPASILFVKNRYRFAGYTELAQASPAILSWALLYPSVILTAGLYLFLHIYKYNAINGAVSSGVILRSEILPAP